MQTYLERALVSLIDDPNTPAVEFDLEFDRLLDVALTEFAAHGTRRTSLVDIAQRAGMSRPTVYRRCGNKSDLIQALVFRETSRFFAELRGTEGIARNLESRSVEAFVVGLRTARTHPLVTGILAQEPDALIPHLATGGTSTFGLLQTLVGRYLSADQELTPAIDRAAEVLTRLCVSFVLAPDSLFDFGSDKAMRKFAQKVIAPAVHGAATS